MKPAKRRPRSIRPAGAVADRREHLLLERLEPVVDELLLGGEVVEDRRFRHLRIARDLGHGDGVEAPLDEEAPRRLGDQRPVRSFFRSLSPGSCRHRLA